MAYVSKDKKAKIKQALDAVLKGTGVKATLAVRHHSTIVCTIHKGPIDFIGNFKSVLAAGTDSQAYAYEISKNYMDVNPYHYKNQFSGEVLELVGKILGALNTDNFDESDSQTDYFHVGHYLDLNIGRYDKPYEFKKD